MTMQLAGFTVSVQQAIEIIYVEIDAEQLCIGIERWLADQDLSALEADMAAEREMEEQYFQGWMT